jgi:hypothetical protein
MARDLNFATGDKPLGLALNRCRPRRAINGVNASFATWGLGTGHDKSPRNHTITTWQVARDRVDRNTADQVDLVDFSIRPFIGFILSG